MVEDYDHSFQSEDYQISEDEDEEFPIPEY
jgi:hypothetical protein